MSRRPRWYLILSLCALFSLLGMAGPTAPHMAQAKPAAAPATTIGLSTAVPGNRFASGQPVTINLTLSNPAPVPHTYTRAETLTDYAGGITSLLTDTVTLAAGQTLTGTVAVPVRGNGYFELHVTLTDTASATQVSAFLPFAVLQPQGTGLDPRSAFGINGNLTGAYGSNGQAMSGAASAMAAAGVRYDREELNWQVIEPKPGSGQFNFARTDAAIIAAHNAGIQVLGLLAYWGNLPQPDTTTTISGTYLLNTITGCSKGAACAYTPQGDALFAAYSAAVVNHYRPGGTLAQQQGWTDNYGISDWEVWNEPSTIAFWRHDIVDYPARFASLYKAASAAVRQSDPGARVMYDESGQAIDQAIVAAGGTSNIASVHSYSGGLDPDAALASPTLPRGGQGTAPAAIGSIVAQGLPVWITETGYATDGTVTPRQQAQYLVRSYVDFLATGVQKNFWFKFREDSPGGDNLYGITSQNGAPKPAYVAYATMARHLQDATFAGSVQLGTAVRGDVFSRPDGSAVAVLWSTAENGAITLPSGSLSPAATADDLMDNPISRQNGAALTVPISGDPAFLTAPGTTAAQLSAALQHVQITGINPVGVAVDQAPGLINGLPDLKVTVSARTNVPISGTVTLGLPTGWAAIPALTRFATLQPGQSRTLNFHLNSESNHTSDVISATAATSSGLRNTGSSTVTPYALTYGHPAIDGTLTTWATASRADLINLRPEQVVGIPGWTPQNLSASVYTMWDEQYFYLAAQVYDQTFDYAPIGYNMYKGDSIQYGWGMDPDAYLRDTGPNRYNVTAGLTHQGAANFQYNLLGPWTDMKQAIKLSPTNPHLLTYTTAIPWSRLGNYVPKVGNQFAFNLIVNQNEKGARIGWIQFAPGIGIGFRPSQWPLWTIIRSNPAAGLRVGGLSAPTQGTVSFTLPAATGQLVVHNGGLRSISLSINGTPVALSVGSGLLRNGATTIDISRYVHAGTNTVQASGQQAGRASVAVLSFFQ